MDGTVAKNRYVNVEGGGGVGGHGTNVTAIGMRSIVVEGLLHVRRHGKTLRDGHGRLVGSMSFLSAESQMSVRVSTAPAHLNQTHVRCKRSL